MSTKAKQKPGEKDKPARIREEATVSLDVVIDEVMRPIFRRVGPAGRLFADWALMVGPELAPLTQPLSLRAGVLTIACHGTQGLQIAHMAPLLLDRLRTASGLPYRQLHRLRTEDRPLLPPPQGLAMPPSPKPLPKPDSSVTELAERIVGDVTDPTLRATLISLACALVQRSELRKKPADDETGRSGGC